MAEVQPDAVLSILDQEDRHEELFALHLRRAYGTSDVNTFEQRLALLARAMDAARAAHLDWLVAVRPAPCRAYAHSSDSELPQT